MLNRIVLPELQNFDHFLKCGNIHRSFEYLLYFAKSQIKNCDKELIEIDKNNGKKLIPTWQDRYFILNKMKQYTKITEYNSSSSQLMTEQQFSQSYIISVQKFIMGLILLGHVHIYEFLIREVFPDFLKLLEEKSEEKNCLRNKMAQFYKQTFFLLSLWFPKCFYKKTEISWFKKVVNKFNISIEFLIYYTEEKLQKLEAIIKSYYFYQDQKQCVECHLCLQSVGKYNSLGKSIKNLSEISIVDSQKYKNEVFSQYFPASYISEPQIQKNNESTKSQSLILEKIQKIREKSKKAESKKSLRALYTQSKIEKKNEFTEQQEQPKTMQYLPLNSLSIDEKQKNINNESQSIFQSKLYQKMGSVNRNIFKKQCLKKGNKKYLWEEEKQTYSIQIKLKSHEKKLQVKVKITNTKDERKSIVLVQPRQTRILIKEKDNQAYFFNFQFEFVPLVVRIQNGPQILLPISMISMLEPILIKQSHPRQDMMKSANIVEKQIVSLNGEIFKTIMGVAACLKMCSETPISINSEAQTFRQLFYFFSEVIEITIEKGFKNGVEEKWEVNIVHGNKKSENKMEELLKQICTCIKSGQSTLQINSVIEKPQLSYVFKF